MINKNILKQWFSNGKRPNQNQFWEWIESYWHKEEKIPQSSIEGLSQSLSDKADGKQVQIHLTDEDAHDLKNKLAKKVDNIVYQEHLSEENAHGIKDKLAEKVSSEIYYEHLIDEEAHGLKDKLDQKADITYVNKTIDDIQIGGTNLLIDKNVVGIDSSPEFFTKFGNNNYYAECWATSIVEGGRTKEMFVKGGVYTISYTVELLEDFKEGDQIDEQARGELGIYNSSIKKYFRMGYVPIEQFSKLKKGDRYYVKNTFEIDFDVTNLYKILVYSGYLNNEKGNRRAKINFLNLKIEKGNKATDWSPAPEDIDNIQIGGRNYLQTNVRNLKIRDERYQRLMLTEPIDGFITISGRRKVVKGKSSYSLIIFRDEKDNSLDFRPIPILLGEEKVSFTINTKVKVKSLLIYSGTDWAYSEGIHTDLFDLQVEKGNKVTDWTPPLEELEKTVQETVLKTIFGGRNYNLNSHKEKTNLTRIRYELSKDFSENIKRKKDYSFVISFDVKHNALQGNEKTLAYVLSSNMNDSLGDINFKLNPTKVNEWYRIELPIKGVFTSAQENLVYTTTSLAIEPGENFSVKNMQTERGDIPSDWTPAIEDTQEELKIIKQLLEK